MSLWAALRGVYVTSWRFCRATPLLILTSVVIEGLQHVVEWRLGMYAGSGGMARAAAAASDPLRLAAGMVKVSWLFALGYWVSRFVVSGENRAATLRRDPVAVRLYARVFVVAFAISAVSVFGPLLAGSVGVSPRTAQLGLLAFSVVTFPVGIALALWAVQAALGDTSATLLGAARKLPGSILWGLALQVLAILAPMAVHYALSYAAIARGGGVGMALLVVDAIEVGFLGVVIQATYAVIAMRMADRHGAPLSLPAGPA